MATKTPTARPVTTQRVRTHSDSDRVRNETQYDPQQRTRQIGVICHRALGELAALERPVTDTDIDEVCESVLARVGVQAPRHLSRPIRAITGAVNTGVALLPPFTWRLIATESHVPPTSGSAGGFVDQVYETVEPVIVGDHIGDILGVEVKQGACADTATLPATRAQVGTYLDGLTALFPGRLLGVATILLGQPNASLLTLADDQRTEVPLATTDLWTFPIGRRV